MTARLDTNASAARVRCPVGALPSRVKLISFLSPAPAAGALTFCYAAESRQRTQPRGLRPLGHPPTTATRRKFGLAPTPLRLCKTPVGVPSGTRPRATATEATVCCRASAKADTVGRLPFQRMPVPTSYTSPPVGSTRRAAITVRTVFSCVASRNTQRMSYWGSLSRILNRACRPAGLLPRAGIKPSGRAGPSPLGENQSLSSPPLEPRGLLLSVMRQKVGKERSQEGCAPLANPQRFLACHLRKFGPSPTPPSGSAEAGDSASRYFLRPKLSRDLPTTAAATPLRTGLQLENRDLRSRAPPPPPAEGATSLLLRRLRGRLRKRTSPHGLWPRAWEILPFQLIVETVYFPFKARRAVV